MSKKLANTPVSRPREDWGFFGPSSPTWRVWSAPTAFLAFRRSIVVQCFDPYLAIAVHESNGVRTNPRKRLDRTLHYFLTVACGDSRSAIEASDLLMRVHANAAGTEPVSRTPYCANDPETQLWIHVTGWHSNLLCYERFGPGPRSPADEARYWQECAIAAELQTCDPALLPRSRDEVREFYASVRSRLCMTEHARALIHYFLAPNEKSPLPGVIGEISTKAVVSTIPRWMRELAGIEQSRAVDVALAPVVRAAVRRYSRPELASATIGEVSPSAVALYEQVVRKTPPLRDEVVSPAQARERLER
jgi:uncharacterized protein (DUF2236 family)